jgi:hypothetical protein
MSPSDVVLLASLLLVAPIGIMVSRWRFAAEKVVGKSVPVGLFRVRLESPGPHRARVVQLVRFFYGAAGIPLPGVELHQLVGRAPVLLQPLASEEYAEALRQFIEGLGGSASVVQNPSGGW